MSVLWKRLTNIRIWTFPLTVLCIALLLTVHSRRNEQAIVPPPIEFIEPPPAIEPPPVDPWIAPPPMGPDGTETIFADLTLEQQFQGAVNELLRIGVEFNCRFMGGPDPIAAADSPFENRLLTLFVERSIDWQQLMHGSTPRRVYEIGMRADELPAFLQDVTTLADENGWMLEQVSIHNLPPLNLPPLLNAIQASDDPNRNIRVRFTFEM